jgi:predicted component of type VI protein secretion system
MNTPYTLTLEATSLDYRDTDELEDEITRILERYDERLASYTLETAPASHAPMQQLIDAGNAMAERLEYLLNDWDNDEVDLATALDAWTALTEEPTSHDR